MTISPNIDIHQLRSIKLFLLTLDSKRGRMPVVVLNSNSRPVGHAKRTSLEASPTQMLPYWIAGGILALGAFIVFMLRDGGTPSIFMFQEIREAVLALQKVASSQIKKITPDGDIQNLLSEEMLQQAKRVQETIRLVYTIDSEDAGFVHTISLQLIARKPEKYAVQSMLIVMMTLTQQMETAGIEPKSIQFDISRSDLGTHFLAMVLSPEQNKALLSVCSTA